MKKSNGLFLVLPLIIFSLLCAVWSGWLRLGWTLPALHVSAHHGALMVNGFLAAVISLERAVAVKTKWALAIPFANAFGAVLFVAGFTLPALLCGVAGAAVFVLLCGHFLLRYKEYYYGIFLTGAVFLLAGNLVLAFQSSYPTAVFLWMGFLLLTVVAERIELSRFLKLSNAQRLLLSLCLLIAASGFCTGGSAAGRYLVAAGLLGTGLWLLRFDMARHSVRLQGQHRYSGLLLLVGYGWLIVCALLVLFQAAVPLAYDAILHSFFIGFVFSMIFSHAPIILPALTKRPVKIFRPVLYVWFGLLQASLLARLLGDLAGNVLLRKVAGGINGITVLLFFLTVAVTYRREVADKNQGLRKP